MRAREDADRAAATPARYSRAVNAPRARRKRGLAELAPGAPLAWLTRMRSVASAAACCAAEPPLPSHHELVSRFGLFAGGNDGCAPAPSAGGAFACACAGCGRWKAFVEGRLPEEGGTHPRYEARVS